MTAPPDLPPGALPGAIWHPSPNHGPRRGDAAPDMVVIHYTAMADAASAIHRLCDPAAQVSAHYLIARDGTLIAMVAEDRRAWHAGHACWAGERDINSRAIGIELDNPGLDAAGLPVPFSAALIARLEDLLADIITRYAIPPSRVLGHACVAPGRKHDPGPAFDWRRLAGQGLAIWADPLRATFEDMTEARAREFRAVAMAIGIDAGEGADWDHRALAAWSALAARFLPALAGRSRPSPAAVAHLARLATEYPGTPPGAGTDT
ncbi:MAG: N-acetylmuramoyl-L-alanine amidase [Pseudomonadota bacterium]